MKKIFFFLPLFYSSFVAKNVVGTCPLSPMLIDTMTLKSEEYLMDIPLKSTYLSFGFGFDDTTSIKIGEKVYEDVELLSHPISDVVVGLKYKLDFKDEKPMPFEINTKNCRIRLKTDILYGYKYIQIHYYQDTFRLNYFK